MLLSGLLLQVIWLLAYSGSAFTIAPALATIVGLALTAGLAVKMTNDAETGVQSLTL